MLLRRRLRLQPPAEHPGLSEHQPQHKQHQHHPLNHPTHPSQDQLSSTLGHSGAPSLLAVGTVLGSLLLVNSLIYVGMLHVLYSIMLRGMGLEMSPMPAAVQRFVYRGQAPPAPAAGGGAGDAGA